MNEVEIEIPPDARMVKLALEERVQRLTLRSLLPLVKGDVELVVEDEFDLTGENRCRTAGSDLYRLKAESGSKLLEALERSKVVDGKALLGQTPSIQRADPPVSLYNGTFGLNMGTGCIQFWVKPPAPDEED